MKSLEKRRILLKGTTRKITSQKQAFLNFLRPLMTVGLPLMKTVLTPLARNVLCHCLNYRQECQQQMQLFRRKFRDQAQQHQ